MAMTNMSDRRSPALIKRSAAKYRLPHDSEAVHRCGYCIFFADTSCKFVEGEPAFWATCQFWEGAPRGRHLAKPYVRKRKAA